VTQLQQDWTLPRLREPIKLVVSQFVISALHQSSDVGLDLAAFDNYFGEALHGEAFLALRGIAESIPRDGEDDLAAVTGDALLAISKRRDPASDQFTLRQIRDLVVSLARTKNLLRNLRNREEDISKRRNQTIQRNYSAFLSVVAAVYSRLPPDSALPMWDLPMFTETVLEIRGNYHQSQGFWEALEAMSRGTDCATKAFEKLKGKDLDLCNISRHYVEYLSVWSNLHDPARRMTGKDLDQEVGALTGRILGWTRLLMTIVKYSTVARSTVPQQRAQNQPSIIDCIFQLLSLDIDIELRAVLLDAVAALCSGRTVEDPVLSGTVGLYERLAYPHATERGDPLDLRSILSPHEWVIRFTQIEMDNTTYPITQAHVRFLTSLLPDAASIASDSNMRINTTRRRATKFVLDTLFDPRRCSRDDERLELLDVSLAFVEKALLGFDMGEMIKRGISGDSKAVATSIREQPGYLVLEVLLSQRTICGGLADILDHTSALSSPRSAKVDKLLLRVLRILYRVLDVQLVYTDVLLPALTEFYGPDIPFRPPGNQQTLDQFLLTRLSNVKAVALLVGDDNSEISFLSTKIIAS
jgi:nuclear pore complex protein Nup205